MTIKEKLIILAQRYDLNYQYQQFDNCYGGYWFVCTHSIYNKTGCFTVCCLPQRNEISFYYATKFSRNLKELCFQEVDVYQFEKDIWGKNSKIGPLKNPFFYWSENKIVNTLIKVIIAQIEKQHEFFGIKISSVNLAMTHID